MSEDKINGHEAHSELEGVYEVQAQQVKDRPPALAQQTGMRWPSVAALFIICATVVALCWLTSAENLWD
jgi:hypothetical protein